MSRRSWERGSSVLENRRAGIPDAPVGGRRGLGFLDHRGSRELGF